MWVPKGLIKEGLIEPLPAGGGRGDNILLIGVTSLAHYDVAY